MKIVLLIISVLLILVSLLQSGKSEGLSAFTGSNSLDLFKDVKERGPEKIMSIVTMALGVIFFVLVIIIKITE